MQEIAAIWEDIKNNFNANKNSAQMTYVEFTDHYFIKLEFLGYTLFKERLLKQTSDCAEFEATYKAQCNIPQGDRVRLTTCRFGRKLHDRFITFTTADQGKFDNTDWQDNDYGDVTYTMKDVNGATTTDNALAKELWLDINTGYSFEIAGGRIDVPSFLPGDPDLWEIHVVGFPTLPPAAGGNVHFVANSRIKFLAGKGLQLDASLNPAEVPFVHAIYPQIRVVVKHPVGEKIELQLNLRLFK